MYQIKKSQTPNNKLKENGLSRVYKAMVLLNKYPFCDLPGAESIHPPPPHRQSKLKVNISFI
jgi:hypothetical protein